MYLLLGRLSLKIRKINNEWEKYCLYYNPYFYCLFVSSSQTNPTSPSSNLSLKTSFSLFWPSEICIIQSVLERDHTPLYAILKIFYIGIICLQYTFNILMRKNFLYWFCTFRLSWEKINSLLDLCPHFWV